MNGDQLHALNGVIKAIDELTKRMSKADKTRLLSAVICEAQKEINRLDPGEHPNE